MGHRHELISRQWEILHRLSQGKVLRQALRDEFNVSRETIKRDIDVLSRLFPIMEERCGNEITYSFMEGYQFPSIWFSSEEISSLLLAEDVVLQALQNLPQRDAFGSVLSKLKRMQAGSSERVRRSLPEVFQSDFSPPESRSNFQQRLLEAALAQRQVRIRYFTAYRQAESIRTVEPYVLRLTIHGLHLIAYCHSKERILFFNVNRIREMEELEESFDLEKRSFDLRSYLEESFGGVRKDPIYRVRLLIQAPTAYWARELYYHPTQEIREVEDGIELTFRSGGMEAIVRQVVHFGPDCQVLEPKELRQQVIEYLEKSLQTHRSS